MSKPCDKTFLLVQSLGSSVKVEYQGHNLKKNDVAGALVFHKHILFVHSVAPKRMVLIKDQTAHFV